MSWVSEEYPAGDTTFTIVSATGEFVERVDAVANDSFDVNRGGTLALFAGDGAGPYTRTSAGVTHTLRGRAVADVALSGSGNTAAFVETVNGTSQVRAWRLATNVVTDVSVAR